MVPRKMLKLSPAGSIAADTDLNELLYIHMLARKLRGPQRARGTKSGSLDVDQTRWSGMRQDEDTGSHGVSTITVAQVLCQRCSIRIYLYMILFLDQLVGRSAVRSSPRTGFTWYIVHLGVVDPFAA